MRTLALTLMLVGLPSLLAAKPTLMLSFDDEEFEASIRLPQAGRLPAARPCPWSGRSDPLSSLSRCVPPGLPVFSELEVWITLTVAPHPGRFRSLCDYLDTPATPNTFEIIVLEPGRQWPATESPFRFESTTLSNEGRIPSFVYSGLI